MKTIAVIASCDTKHAEVEFICDRIAATKNASLVIDVSTSPRFVSTAHIKREQIAAALGIAWKDVEGGQKHELLELMTKGAAKLVPSLYASGAFDGIMAIGGLQNTTVGVSAMKHLPIGVPKVVVSTVATGQRTFDSIVGTKDITVMPSITDFGSVNLISETILNNAVGAIIGMVQHAGRELPKASGMLIGTTLMGATDDGVVNAIAHMESKGYHMVSFHATGTGGRVMEELMEEDVISAAMDVTLHEVVYEYFGSGFGFGAERRLEQGIKKGLPMVVCPAGIDFICQSRDELFPDAMQRKMIWHNSTLAHVRLTVEEVTDISRIIISRLNQSRGNLTVVMPTRGFRSFTKKGQPLYAPEIDRAIVDVFERELRKDIPCKTIEANFMDKHFSEFAADEMIALINGAGSEEALL